MVMDADVNCSGPCVRAQEALPEGERNEGVGKNGQRAKVAA
jgi:hypothetical protein